jgi:hypothetical protein
MDRDADRCDRGAMIQLAILCHPCTPVSDADLETWLDDQVEKLRREAPEGIIRLSRLSQELPDADIGIGWLIEVELPEESVLLRRDGLADALSAAVTDMRFLGLQPRVLSPLESSERNGGLPGRLSEQTAIASAPILDYPGLQ